MSTVDRERGPAAPPDQARAVATARCPQCGGGLEPDQEWCLDCGTAARTVIAPTPNWRRPIAIIAVVLILCGGALAWAFVALTDNDDEVRNALTAAPATTGARPTATTGVPAPGG